MFVGDEVLLGVTFDVARARLANLTRGGGLMLAAAQDAYGLGIAGLPRASGQGPSELVQVQARELSEAADSAGLAIRWVITGPGDGLFPVLDADIKLTPAERDTTLLTLAGAYRPPGDLGDAPERAIVRRVASATIRNFLARLAAGICGDSGPTESTGPFPAHSA
jgi:hypothetical protein